MPHPVQPLFKDANGRLRFKANPLVEKLLEVASRNGCGLNELAAMDFSREDQVQFMQLIGYSLTGFGELSFVSDDDYAVAERMAEEGKSELQARVEHLQEELDALRSQLREPMARLFGIHPDDLHRG